MNRNVNFLLEPKDNLNFPAKLFSSVEALAAEVDSLMDEFGMMSQDPEVMQLIFSEMPFEKDSAHSVLLFVDKVDNREEMTPDERFNSLMKMSVSTFIVRD
jgi:purine-nucleoside phosphorylase